MLHMEDTLNEFSRKSLEKKSEMLGLDEVLETLPKKETKEYVYHELEGSSIGICGILTVLDYEKNLKDILDGVVFSPSKEPRSVLVDLALKSGLNRYRFLLLKIDTFLCCVKIIP